MDFKTLFFDSSRIVADHAFSVIANDAEKFRDLLDFVLENHPQYSPRASRVLYLLVDKYPDLVLPHLDSLVKNLSINNNSVLRGFLRILTSQVYKLNEEQFGLLMNQCFNLLTDPKSDVAHKIYSMHILYDMYKIEPLIKDELKVSIEENLEFGSTGVKTIGKRILKNLK